MLFLSWNSFVLPGSLPQITLDDGHRTTTNIPASKVLAIASGLRDDGSSAAFCYGIDEKPINLGQSQIYAVKFPDDTVWAVRIPVHADGTLPPSSITSIVNDEMAILTKLKDTGFRWSPSLIGGDSSFDNSLGHPYLVLSWVHGTQLEWTPEKPVEPEQRQKVLRQLVDIQSELAECTKESRTSTTSYLTDIIDGKVERARTGRLPELNVEILLKHRTLAAHAVHESLETLLFTISHGNLASHKIIIDAECYEPTHPTARWQARYLRDHQGTGGHGPYTGKLKDTLFHLSTARFWL